MAEQCPTCGGYGTVWLQGIDSSVFLKDCGRCFGTGRLDPIRELIDD